MVPLRPQGRGGLSGLNLRAPRIQGVRNNSGTPRGSILIAISSHDRHPCQLMPCWQPAQRVTEVQDRLFCIRRLLCGKRSKLVSMTRQRAATLPLPLLVQVAPRRSDNLITPSQPTTTIDTKSQARNSSSTGKACLKGFLHQVHSQLVARKNAHCITSK